MTFALLALSFTSLIIAQEAHLHVDPRWKECSFRLDRSLTPGAWHQFAEEAALVTYFRPLADARPMGVGAVEIALLNWGTNINENDGAWNDTFVHPDSTHWLIGGPKLSFPGLAARVGITRRIDAGFYFTQNPNANYGFMGAQVQYNFLDKPATGWSASARASFSSLFGPEDLEAKNGGLDLIGSRRIKIYSNNFSVSPYAIVSAYLSHASERSAVVNFSDQNIPGVQGAVGAVAQIYIVRLAAEYNLGKVSTLSYKIGLAYTFGKKKERDPDHADRSGGRD
jgi:hypothetical protein